MADKTVIIKLDVQEAGAEAQIVSLNNKLSKLTEGEKDYELVLKKIAIQEERLSKIQAKRATIQGNVLKETKNTTKLLNKQSDATGSATAATMELSRVVSDAPYGIRGMANNITQLVSQLGSASKKAGGLGAALKLMGKQLLGPLGVVFAITAVVAAFDYFYGTATKAEKSINSVAESAAKSASALKILVKANDSGAMSMKETVKAVKKANLEYKDLNIQVGENGKITDESVLAINRKIKSLENLAKATALQGMIEDEFVKMDPLETKLKKQEEEALVKLRVKGINTIKEAQDIADNSKDYALKGYTNGVITQVNSTKDEIDSIQKNIDRLIGKIPNIDDLFKGKDKGKDKDGPAKEFVDTLYREIVGFKDLIVNSDIVGEIVIPITPKITTPYDEIAEFIKQYKVLMSGLSDFIDGEFERELTIEKNKTNALNAELNNRLNNENLSKDQRASIQNEIAQNDEKLRVKQEAIARKQFKVTKAFNIAMTIADTYMAAQKAYLSQMQFDPSSPIRAKIAAGVAVAAGLAKVAAIARTTFQSTAPSTPTNNGGGGGGGSARAEPSFNIVGRSNDNILLSAIQSQFDQPLKAYVVARDVTNQQQLDGIISTAAST
tara:strand:- start:7301 stop:9133 length:1833 start_codon:yes stop_codon:yes gene_type:complete